MAPVLMIPPYEIEILDISHYQNYNMLNQDVGINFKRAKQTRTTLKGIYIKCGEGTWAGYPEDVYKQQALAALEAGWDTSPYHYHHTEIDPGAQAKYFKKRSLLVPYNWIRPVVDIEDTDRQDNQPPKKALTVAEYPIWIPKARNLLGKVKLYMNACAQEFQIAPIMYTADWWIGWIIQLCYMDGVDTSFLNQYYYAIASYTYPWMYLPFGIDKDRIVIWQYTSSPWDSIRVPGFPYQQRLDMNYWLGTEAQYNDLVGGIVAPQPPEHAPANALDILWQAHPELWGKGIYT